MFHRYGKKSVPTAGALPKDATRMASAEQLLADDKRRALMLQIEEACVMEAERFESLCRALVHNLVHYCQQLPEASNSYYSQAGGLLDYALNRTDAALNLFRNYMIRDENAGYSEEQKLWQYALLSAALLQGIGKLMIAYKVELFDSTGQCTGTWNPLLENLSLGGSYYSYSFEKESDHSFRCRLNILLARTIMPVAGFSWIASDQQVLAVWLALLNEDPYSARTLGAILIQADAVAIQRSLSQMAMKGYGARGGRYGRAGAFVGGAAESVNDIEQQIGAEFIQWMNSQLASGALVINKAPLLMVPGGMLLTSDLFKLFAAEHPELSNWQAVRNAFLSLGLHKSGPDGDVTSRFEQTSNQQMHTGIVFSGYAVALPAQMQVHNMHTGRQIAMSGTDVIHMAQFNNYFTRQQQVQAATALQAINAAGQWQAVSAPVSEMAPSIPGVTRGV
ncbi:TraI domain-containing protein [Legionella sp. CNM-4043-24]|uniref:TraI domain-containing protein n=1 Tax=Legionella sp. CNM-4043-24 TaxID=3421646 RepID=UPI00403A91A8